MEDVLAKLMKDSSPVKHATVRQSCSETQELLANQHELLRSPPYEIRSKCLETFKLALESKYSKLVAHALNGFQRLVWDKTFQTVFESNDDETWLPCQLLKAVASISTQNDDVQVEILKILLQMTSTCSYNLSSGAVIQLILLCHDVYSKGSTSVRTAAQATANQTLQVFTLMVQEPDGGNEENDDSTDDSKESGFNVLDGVEELSHILNFICKKLQSNSTEGKSTAPLLLQCILSVLRNLSIDVHQSQGFLNFLWQELCPRLVALLGSPKTDKHIVSSRKNGPNEGKKLGRGSGCLSTAPSCQNAEAKTIFSIAVELVRLVGDIGSLRPVLESLFHRMLLYPPPQHRLEALKAVKELMQNPQLLLKFAGPPLYDTIDKSSRSSDLDLIRIAMDSLGECCHSSDNNVCYTSVSCAAELLRSLEEICKGTEHLDEYANEINTQFKTLEAADYKGIKSDRWLETRGKTSIVVEQVRSNVSSDYSDSDLTDQDVESDNCFDKTVEHEESEELDTTQVVAECCEKCDVDLAECRDSESLNELLSEDATQKVVLHIEDESDSQSYPIPADEYCVTENSHGCLEDYASSSTSVATSTPAIDNDETNILDDLEDEELESAKREADRLNKVPRTLLGQEDAGKMERERVEMLCISRLEFAQQERKNAQKFVEVLLSFLPKLLTIRSSVEADQAMQEFSSNYCEGLWQQQQAINNEPDEILSRITILNADGIYLALYSALLLNLKLIRNSYYHDSSAPVPLTEEQFIEEVHGTGVLVYLSATWLAELYQRILVTNLLEEAGYCPESAENSALVNLLSGLHLGVDNMWDVPLSDVDGLGNSQPGGQQLADYRRLERAVVGIQSSPDIEAGRKFSRRVVSSSWETVLEVLSVLLNGTNSCGITSTLGFLLGTEGAKEEHRKTRDAIAESLDGLQRAAKLCNALGLQSSCSAVFAQLAAASCPLTEDSEPNAQLAASKMDSLQQFRKSLLPGRGRPLRLHTSHVLSMDVMLSRGLELGSHSPSCWKYVFQCCLYVLELENAYFGNYSGIHSLLTRPAVQALKKVVEKKGSSRDESLTGSLEEEDDVHDLLPMPGSAIPQQLNISEIIKKNSDAHMSGVIKDQLLVEVIEGLSQLVDRLFEEAASRLNLSALIGFLVELCASSQIQLFNQNYRHSVPTSSHANSLLLYHLGDIMLRCARGGRPLIHVMKVWSVVAPHFVEAACHKDRIISKKAVTTIHDIVSALLSSNSELPHFHFNEALFKPFENLLCLELCDADVQEQIISSICEFVEGCTTEIRSGWRPLFGALRAVHLPIVSSSTLSIEMEREHSHHLRVVLDVFEAFLGTDNILVFAYAAVDCLLCLLKHVKGPSEETLSDQPDDILEDGLIPIDMCLAALKYLERCNSILSSMYGMPTCPVFNSANRIQIHSMPIIVDPKISDLNIIYFDKQSTNDVPMNSNSSGNKNGMDIDSIKEPCITLKELDKHTGILHVWFLLLEGLAGAVCTCPRRYQPHTMETLFFMLRNIKEVPGHHFGIYCINHLLLPMLQSWLRRISRLEKGWISFSKNFKQCCGLTTDLIVDYIQHMMENNSNSFCEVPGANFMLQQLFLVLTECIAQSSETISRLGCACIRHTILSAGKYFTCDVWDIVCANLQRACQITLHSIQQLLVCFHTDSESFYGDLVEVKVATRKDCSVQETERLRQLAQQVFLLDCQRTLRSISNSGLEEDERSYVFLLHPPVRDGEDDSENHIIRVPFRKLVVCLLSHQILLQTLSTILLHGSRHLLPSLMTSLLFLSLENQNSLPDYELPGFLSKLSPKQLCILFSCLNDSYKTACDFDARPGLKFLIQKVARIDVAANLYKQAGVSWTAYTLALFELCISYKYLSVEKINSQLMQQNENSSGECYNSKSNVEDAVENDNENHISSFFVTLMKKFKDICELYSECAMDKDGLLATVDRMTDQPIFFLVAQCESIADLTSSDKLTSEESVSKDSVELKNDDSSDSEDPPFEDTKDKVYSLATEQTISSLISEYKKRKTRHSMPSTFQERLQKKTKSFDRSSTLPTDNTVPEEIIKQRRASITKDGEAHVQVFKQLVQSVLDLHLSLQDEQFQAFLPVFFPGVQYLVAYTADAEIKLTVAEWLQRVAVCCGFGGTLRCSNLSS